TTSPAEQLEVVGNIKATSGTICDGSGKCLDTVTGTDAIGSLEIGPNAIKDDEMDYTIVTLNDFTNDAGFITSADDTVSGTELDGVFSTTGLLQRTGAGTYSTTSESDPTVEAFAQATLPTCGAGEVLKGDGASLSCVTDQTGSPVWSLNGNLAYYLTDNVGIGTSSPTELLDVSGGIKIGNSAGINAGTLRWTGSDFEGYTGASWDSLTTGTSTISEATDTNINTPASGNLFVYDGIDSWDNVAMSGDATITNTGAISLSSNSVQDAEIDYTSVTLSDFLNDVGFIISAPEGAFSSLTDTDINTPVGGHLVIYDGIDTWNNVAMSGDATINTTGTISIGTGTIQDNEIDYTSVTLSDFTDDVGYLISNPTETDPTVETFAKTTLPTCGAGEILKGDGSSLSCVTDAGATTFLTLTDTPSSYTAGSVIFTSGSATTEDNANLFWDDTNNRLGIGTSAPAAFLDIAASTTSIASLKVQTGAATSSPAAGEMYSDGTDLFFYNGSGWDDLTGGGTSVFTGLTDTPSSYTAGSVLFTSGSAVTEDSGQLFWDDTNNYLGIGTSSPTTTLDISGTATANNFKVNSTGAKGTCDASSVGTIVYETVTDVGTYYGCKQTAVATYEWVVMEIFGG
ncbi:MAG: hypothetical protein OEL89_04785, partial [Candidatus Peregrinibacteria bacterium]|nr:hypothetical protein [Candidatus Peregrinibacteria bacterium]